MTVHQLSVFLTNHPGHLAGPVELLADAGINTVILGLADGESFGILRVVVDDWQRARQVLETAGCVVKVTELVAVDVADEPGGLAAVLAALRPAGVNIEYMYGYPRRCPGRSALLLRFDQSAPALEALRAAGVTLLDFADIAGGDRD